MWFGWDRPQNGVSSATRPAGVSAAAYPGVSRQRGSADAALPVSSRSERPAEAVFPAGGVYGRVDRDAGSGQEAGRRSFADFAAETAAWPSVARPVQAPSTYSTGTPPAPSTLTVSTADRAALGTASKLSAFPGRDATSSAASTRVMSPAPAKGQVFTSQAPAYSGNSMPSPLLPLERPRCRRRPPFAWQPAPDYETEFNVSGASNEVVTKVGDFKDSNWVVPIGGTLRLTKGALYRWTLKVERTSAQRPQMQLGVHGVGHRRPWRLLSTTRCSRARDDEPWADRPDGDRPIEEGDYVHVEVDLRGLHLPFGTLSMAVNSDPAEIIFDDLPLKPSMPLMPVVSMGGDQSCIRLCPSY